MRGRGHRWVVVGAGAVALVVLGVVLVAGLRPASDIEMLRSGDRTLIVHRSTGSSADAVLRGRLGTGPAGCVTVGGDVVILPEGSALAADGSVTIAGDAAVGEVTEPVRVGETVSLGGGAGSAPATVAHRCGTHAEYFWAG